MRYYLTVPGYWRMQTSTIVTALTVYLNRVVLRYCILTSVIMVVLGESYFLRWYRV